MNIVYIHYIDDIAKPFYCGSGARGRERIRGRNKIWDVYAKDSNYKIAILMYGDAKLCLEVETDLTFKWSKKGYCQANVKAGNRSIGDGHMKGVPSPRKGQTLTEEHKNNLRKPKEKKRPPLSEERKKNISNKMKEVWRLRRKENG